MGDEHSGGGDLDRTLRLLWHPEAASGRGPQRSISVTEIVDTAVQIADSRGLEAVSIRSVAAELGVGPMSLYRYIPSKAELLDLMLDRVSRPANTPPPGDWRSAMDVIAREMWRLHTEHRWLPFVDQTRPVLGPNAVSGLDRVMGALGDCPLTDSEKVSFTVAVEALVTSLARTANSSTDLQDKTGLTHEDFWQAQEATLVEAMESGRYPHMAALDADAFLASVEEMFEFGLDALLDGVAALIQGRNT